MSYSPNHNEENIREEDLLDVVEDLEKQRRRLLIEVTHNFVLWGRILTRTKELVQEMKRRKWKE